MSEKDNLYKAGPEHGHPEAGDPDVAGDFVFDERVVRVFPDMIRRSVPGYALVLQMIGLLAHRYVQPDSQVYDLGCSLGAATLAMRQAVSGAGVRFIGVDNSPVMIERCRERLESHDGGLPVDLVLGDILTTPVSNASMTVLNYTLQFVDPKQRLELLNRIARGTRPRGILVLSEKICFADPAEQELQTTLHHDFKRAQG
ncbi:MAG: carboxy-S-adenosyl-L-methionine synthase CmoA, partial [Lysobacterales bacterium]